MFTVCKSDIIFVSVISMLLLGARYEMVWYSILLLGISLLCVFSVCGIKRLSLLVLVLSIIPVFHTLAFTLVDLFITSHYQHGIFTFFWIIVLLFLYSYGPARGSINYSKFVKLSLVVLFIVSCSIFTTSIGPFNFEASDVPFITAVIFVFISNLFKRYSILLFLLAAFGCYSLYVGGARTDAFLIFFTYLMHLFRLKESPSFTRFLIIAVYFLSPFFVVGMLHWLGDFVWLNILLSGRVEIWGYFIDTSYLRSIVVFDLGLTDNYGSFEAIFNSKNIHNKFLGTLLYSAPMFFIIGAIFWKITLMLKNEYLTLIFIYFIRSLMAGKGFHVSYSDSVIIVVLLLVYIFNSRVYRSPKRICHN